MIKLHEEHIRHKEISRLRATGRNALHQIEVDKVKQVVFDAEAVFALLG